MEPRQPEKAQPNPKQPEKAQPNLKHPENTQPEPKRCILCGAEAESFGSHPAAGGRICGGCAAKMSPWFRCGQNTTEAELRAHLAYREENRGRVESFRPTLRLWKNPAVYLDEVLRQFAVSDAAVKEFPVENPDVLEYAQILQCDVEIEEHRTELKRLSPGQGRVSYRPKRYDYRFHIWVRILVAHPFFHEIRFPLNQRPIVVKSRDVEASVLGKKVKSREYQADVRMAEEIRNVLLKARDLVLAEKAEAEEIAEAAEGEAYEREFGIQAGQRAGS